MPQAKSRIPRDAYYTPDRLVRAYLDGHRPIELLPNATVLEPCCGQNAIVDPLYAAGYRVRGTDLTDGPEFDATKLEYWESIETDWVIGNPPFNVATKIITHAIDCARVGVIMLLRQTYLEPCVDRRHLLSRGLHQITFVNPRPKFRVGESGSDMSTVAFFVWLRDKQQPGVKHTNLIDWNQD